jgi:hypothetical protein
MANQEIRDPAYFTKARRLFKKTFILTRPPQRAKTPFPQARPSEVRDAKNNESHGTSVNAAETVRRQCLARTPLADFFNSLLNSGMSEGQHNREG